MLPEAILVTAFLGDILFRSALAKLAQRSKAVESAKMLKVAILYYSSKTIAVESALVYFLYFLSSSLRRARNWDARLAWGGSIELIAQDKVQRN